MVHSQNMNQSDSSLYQWLSCWCASSVWQGDSGQQCGSFPDGPDQQGAHHLCRGLWDHAEFQHQCEYSSVSLSISHTAMWKRWQCLRSYNLLKHNMFNFVCHSFVTQIIFIVFYPKLLLGKHFYDWQVLYIDYDVVNQYSTSHICLRWFFSLWV